MKTRSETAAYCLSLPETYSDFPFDDNWQAIRHKGNKKCFAFIFDHNGGTWLNVKCDPEWKFMWLNSSESIVPAYHMNKKHWISIILDGKIFDETIRMLIENSYDLTD